MIDFYFNQHFIWLAAALLFLVFSLTAFVKEYSFSLILLLIATALLGTWAILKNEHLGIWDEQVHALVAKNLIQDPLKPTLFINPIMNYDYRNWLGNHVWLHKQPWFLWQMALSLKTFGINTFALRLPNLLMFIGLVALFNGIGKELINRRVGYFMALLASTNYILIALVGGQLHTDHNDMATIFYISASFYAWVKYRNTKATLWAILMGCFAGIAVMNKSLVGLMVFLPFAFSMDLKNRKDWLHGVLAASVSLVVFLPWAIYSKIQFPIEAAYESEMRFKHILHAIEGHREEWWYYFKQLLFQYSTLTFFVLALSGIVVTYLQKSISVKIKRALLLTFILVFGFYTFAQTKMPVFTFILAPIVVFVMANSFDRVFTKLKRKWLIIPIALIFLVSGFQINTAYKRFQTKSLWEHRGKHSTWYKNEASHLWDEKTVVIGLPQYEHLIAMFYTDAIAYDYKPGNEGIKKAINQGYRVVEFIDFNDGEGMFKEVNDHYSN